MTFGGHSLRTAPKIRFDTPSLGSPLTKFCLPSNRNLVFLYQVSMHSRKLRYERRGLIESVKYEIDHIENPFSKRCYCETTPVPTIQTASMTSDSKKNQDTTRMSIQLTTKDTRPSILPSHDTVRSSNINV